MKVAADMLVDGRYRLVEKIGSGGMADVWRADDMHLGRKVALKLLHERFAQDKEFVERFRREAESAAALQHPNVVSVFDRGEFEGTYYIAMEYLEGESLKRRIARGLSAPEALNIVRQILAAAQFAHQKGIIHRDFKPQNVIIAPDGKATVTDFGIAHAGASEITQTGSVMGTAHYLSPEQAQGLPVTATSDLYSIGVILYECLTRRVPFEADSSVAVALKQVSETPLRPSAINPAISPALDAVVMRALAKDPGRRFADADAFSAALDQAEANPQQPSADDTAAFALPPPTRQLNQPPPPATSVLDQPGSGGWSGRRILLVILALLAVAAIVFALTRPEKVLVPSVVGTQVDAATQTLEAAGFDVNIDTVVNNASTDTVLEQDPTAGSKSNKGSTVVLTVSSGPGTAPVPQVKGLSIPVATKKLKDAGFEVETKEKFSKTVPKGDAAGTDPGAGAEVRRGTTVTLFVSKGANQVTVPNVVGLTRESARSTIKDAGLTPEISERDDPAPAGEVLEQDPGAGTMADKGSSVTITISTGHFQVADVVGLTQSKATKVLRKQGLSVSVVEQPTSKQSEDGKVIEQDPPDGTEVTRGEVVTITVGKFGP